MHIVMILSNAFRPDPRVLKEAQSLANTGYRITIICWDRLSELKSHESLSDRLNILRIQNINSSYGIGLRQINPLVRFWRSAARIINELNPDIVHCHDYDTILLGLVWGKFHHKPVIYDAHEYYADLIKPRISGIIGTIIYFFIRVTEKLIAILTDAVVTVDEKLAELYSHFNRRTIIIGHYPQVTFIQPKSQAFTHRQLILLYAGRISTDRGSLVYIDLLRILVKMGIPAKLRFVGIYTPTDEEVFVHENLSGLENDFEYLGWIPYQQMIDIYNSADIGLSILKPLPRYVSALPVKLFEYMACGLPVLASNFPSIISIIDEANCGCYVDPNSETEEVAKVIEKWWNNPIIPQMMGENGIKAVSIKYNWEIQINKLIDLYKDLVD